jgi:hypothetical protein
VTGPARDYRTGGAGGDFDGRRESWRSGCSAGAPAGGDEERYEQQRQERG